MFNSSVKSRVIGRLGKLAYRNKTSEPFLTGDLFASKADYIVPSNFYESKNILSSIRMSKVIFCCGDYAEEFLECFGGYLAGKILIVGNSDKDWLEFPMDLTPRINSVFLQNSFSQDPRIITLPIGIENIAHFRNGRKRNFSNSLVLSSKVDRVLVGPFSPTHKVRSVISTQIYSSPRLEVVTGQQLDPYQYAVMSSRFGYIACPRGNGEDTHRIWESLYRGSSPVLIRNEWSCNLDKYELPSLLIEEWNVDNLEKIRSFRKFNPAEIKALWWPFWREKINSLL